MQDLTVLEEVLRMVLEILNSCLSHQLVYCPNLVYTLLYKRDIFSNFRSHASFQDIIQNIDMVGIFFELRNLNFHSCLELIRSLDFSRPVCKECKISVANWA